MIDPDAFAALLCDWCLEVAEAQQVLVASSTLAEPLLGALHRAILTRGAWPLIRIELPERAEEFYELASDRQLDSFPAADLAEVERIDSHLRIDAPANLRSLESVDPERIARATKARARLREERLARRWCGTIWPTAALAQQAGMGEREYGAFLNRALFLDRPNAGEEWRELSRRQQRLVDRLAGVSEIRIESEGTDLTLRVDGRTWVNSDGRRNMPSGEVFTGPLERSANGTTRFTIPSNRAVEVDDAELRFRNGEVVEASARRGEEYLHSTLRTDPGARFLGELGIGTNPGIDRATGSTLLDEKIAGTVHMALGRSYPETGGTNESAVHWDLICDLRAGGSISADGEPLDLEPFTSRDGHSGVVQ